MTSYILYKCEFLWLMNETGFVNSEITQLFRDCEKKDSAVILRQLSQKGFININGEKISTERTAALLMYQLSKADKVIYENGGVCIFRCPDMYIIISNDDHNRDKCRITPFRNKMQTAEYLKDRNIYLQEETL